MSFDRSKFNMNETSEKSLIEAIKNIKLKPKNSKTHFLETPNVLKAIGDKVKHGATSKDIHAAIVLAGHKISIVTFRRWFNDRYKKND